MSSFNIGDHVTLKPLGIFPEGPLRNRQRLLECTFEITDIDENYVGIREVDGSFAMSVLRSDAPDTLNRVE